MAQCKKQTENGTIEAQMEALRAFARKSPAPCFILNFCRQKGLNEKESFHYLASVESDAEKRRLYERMDITMIPASSINIDGIELGQVRELFHALYCKTEDRKLVGMGYISHDETWDISGTIKPDMRSIISNVFNNLLDLCMDILAPGQEKNEAGMDSSIFIKPDPGMVLIDYLNEPCVFLEIWPGKYGRVAIDVIIAEAKRINEISQNDVIQAPENNDVMEGIAMAFKDYILADDKTLSFVIYNHRLPEGHAPLRFIGKKRVDAWRMSNEIGMKVSKWNECFEMHRQTKNGIDTKPLDDNNKDSRDYRYYDKDNGIFIPLAKYKLIKY